MIKSRMQLNALIRNKVAGDGDKAQILLRIYMMERLLERSRRGQRYDSYLESGCIWIWRGRLLDATARGNAAGRALY